jgi:phage gpG-like protein
MRETSFRVEDRAVKRRLRSLVRKAESLKPMFRDFDRDVGTYFRRRFETAGRHGGTPWKPLSLRTRKARQRADADQNRGGVGKPLWASGRLKRSLEEVGPHSIRTIRRDRYVRGTRVPYAVRHQRGEGVPEREIVPTGGSHGIPTLLWLKLKKRLIQHFGL